MSPVAGRLAPLEEVDDDVFAQRIMGDGIAVVPSEGAVHAPVGGAIEKLFPGGHAFVIETPEGVQVMVHVGIDTVELEGEGFTVEAEEGQTVAVGDHIESIDLDALRARDIDLTTPVVVISDHEVEVLGDGQVAVGDPLFDARTDDVQDDAGQD